MKNKHILKGKNGGPPIPSSSSNPKPAIANPKSNATKNVARCDAGLLDSAPKTHGGRYHPKAISPPAYNQKFRVVLVEPEYSINLGAVCRAMSNFGFSDLAIVNPKCPIGFTAKKYAKHAKHILLSAKLAKSVKDAVSGCDFIVGTTGVLRRHKATLRDPATLSVFSKSIPKGRIAVLFGREGIGLMRNEIDMCDMLVRIETSDGYPIMNLSHAVAVFLYSVSKHGIPEFEMASSG
ncbi:MAG TPA: RNA methyltransferase, partial [Candidatus Micrarchaeota archaeon]|nr:RNA methyltransferase [Candidatus Micrarchaeota archaeon]